MVSARTKSCKHNQCDGTLNPLSDLDLKRIECLPLLKAVVEGRVRADVYKQPTRNGEDKIEIVVDGPDVDYMVVLGCVKGYYIIRSAYPAGSRYVNRVKERSVLAEQIIP